VDALERRESTRLLPGHRPCSAIAIAASWGKDLCARRLERGFAILSLDYYVQLRGILFVARVSRNVRGRLSAIKGAPPEQNRDALVIEREGRIVDHTTADAALYPARRLFVKVETKVQKREPLAFVPTTCSFLLRSHPLCGGWKHLVDIFFPAARPGSSAITKNACFTPQSRQFIFRPVSRDCAGVAKMDARVNRVAVYANLPANKEHLSFMFLALVPSLSYRDAFATPRESISVAAIILPKR